METRAVKIGNIIIGGGFPVTIQTMWKEALSHAIDSVISGLKELAEIGTDIVRFSTPDIESAEVLSRIALSSPIPVVADIHFDYKIALKCIEGGVHKIRINPGNIGAPWKVEEVVRAASGSGVPIRVGVNGGSLPTSLRERTDLPAAMVEAAEMEMNIFEKLDFKEVVFSLKSSDIESTVMANRIFSKKYSYPLHLGVTEAGPLIPGLVKSSIALNTMLRENIGATIRVSLSDSMRNEVIGGKEILKAAGRLYEGINTVSCPKCGRASFDTHSFMASIDSQLQKIKKNLTIAVMGCIVNGPGEARHADLGITGSGDKVVIFKKGEIINRCDPRSAVGLFLKELERF